MDTFMNGAMVIEGALLSFFVALWMTWLGLRGLFRLMPATSQSVQRIRFAATQQQGNRRREVA
jgi:hypothetical protein